MTTALLLPPSRPVRTDSGSIPGNIGGRKAIEKVLREAKARGVPIRIGVNAGSLQKEILKKHGHPTPEAMVESAMEHVRLFESLGFDQIKISLKSSNVLSTVKAYELLSRQVDYPLHLGVTEAGTLISGTVKNALGIGILLSKGIGDTLRVSLSADPVEEVKVGYEILRALNLRHRGPEIISCPTCGRCEIDLFTLVREVETALVGMTSSPKVAIMGCVVNGPGEAREADVGIAGGRHQGVLFRKGRLVRKVPEKDMARVLIEEVMKLADERESRRAITKARRYENTKEERVIEQKALFRAFQFSCFRGYGLRFSFCILSTVFCVLCLNTGNTTDNGNLQHAATVQ